MRDQPFKRFSPLDIAKNQQNYKYPTYQHYYELRVSSNQEHNSSTKMQTASEKNIPKVDQYFPSPPLAQKKSNKSSLKVQLQNLKLEVKRIMQRKQGILKSPIEKKTFTFEKMKGDNQFQQSQTNLSEESEETHSVNSDSDKLLSQELKKPELKGTTQNGDRTKDLEVENKLLKTELKNLKNEYSNKKQELNEKCNTLEKKVVFLESSLNNSEQSLAAQIATLKESLKQVETEKSGLITTVEKTDTKELNSQTKDIEYDTIKEKIKTLEDQIATKNKDFKKEKKEKENLQVEITKLKKNIFQNDESIQSLNKQLQQLRKTNNTNIQLLSQQQSRIQELEDQQYKQNFQRNEKSKSSLPLFQEKLSKIKSQYEQKLEQVKKECQELSLLNKKAKNGKLLLEQEVRVIKNEKEQYCQQIEQLNMRIKQESDNSKLIQSKYLQILQKAQKKHEDSLKNLHFQYQSQIMSLSAKKESRSVRANSISEMSSQERIGNIKKQNSPAKDRQVRKWKCQYKQLKEKYQRHLKAEASKRQQIKQYYKNYRDYKQKAEIYGQKLKLFEKQFQKYLSILTTKENELLKKQAEIKNIISDRNLQKKTHHEQISTLTEKNKNLEEKLNEELQKSEKESAYRKEIQQRVFNNSVSDDSIKEVMQRMKKRLAEQDEKYSKNVKEIKNKETLNTKLKQELREVMESMEKKMNEQKAKQIEELVNTHISKQLNSFKEWKSRTEAQHKVITQFNIKSGTEIQELKKSVYEKEEAMTAIQNQLTNFEHAYNIKSMEMNEVIDQKEGIILRYNEQLEQLNVIKGSVENILREEIIRKNEEITSLRMQITTQSIRPFEHKSYHTKFDDILKSHIEENKKLREDITKKTEQIFRLRDNSSTIRSQYQNLKSQIEINKLKTISETKNLEVNFQIEIQKIKNQLDMSQKKANLLDQKFKLLIEENRKKDSFIQTYIVGKKLTQTDKDLVINFIKQYEITVGSSDIVQRLSSQTKEIEQLNNYNRTLLKEISVLKQRLLQFEAIDEEKVSIFDSKLSKYSANSNDLIEELAQDINLIELKGRNASNSPDSRIKKAESMQNFTIMEHQI